MFYRYLFTFHHHHMLFTTDSPPRQANFFTLFLPCFDLSPTHFFNRPPHYKRSCAPLGFACKYFRRSGRLGLHGSLTVRFLLRCRDLMNPLVSPAVLPRYVTCSVCNNLHLGLPDIR